MDTFSSDKKSLQDLLREITEGKVQLPDFQRGWVWDEAHIKDLLVSIARSFPIGAVMMMETGGEVKFQMRPVEGTEETAQANEAERLILDGQQRLTSLTQATKLIAPVATKTNTGKAVRRHFYFDIETALQGEEYLEDAVIIVDENRQLRSNFGRTLELDLSTPELEYQQLYFPCDQVFNASDWEMGLMGLQDMERMNKYMLFRKSVLSSFQQYNIPIIELKKTTSKEAVCLVFEKVNTGGVPLSVFELITASYAAEDFNLRDDWYGNTKVGVSARQQKLRSQELLKGVQPTDFLQALTLLHTLEQKQADITQGKTGKQIRPVSIKRSAVLSLPLPSYQRWCEPMTNGFMQAAEFLRQQCILSAREIPYSTQLVPLAAVMATLGDRWREPKIKEKLEHWYWCGVLGELYGGAVETRAANDYEELLEWLTNGGEVPRTISDASFDPDRLKTLRSRQSAAYKGINALLLREGARDFFWNQSVSEIDRQSELFTTNPLDIHHIFPKRWCEEQGIEPRDYDSILNKTPISYKANRKIGGAAPSQYLPKLQAEPTAQITNEQMDTVLESHLINPAMLRADDFDGLRNQCKQALMKMINAVMQKDNNATFDWLPHCDAHYQAIAKRAIQLELPAPVIGYDLADEHGEVQATAGLAWEELRVAVVDDEDYAPVNGWKVIKHSSALSEIETIALSNA